MRIVITGEGIISAIGLNKQQVLDALRKKRSGIGRMHHLHSIHRELPVGEVPLSTEKMRRQLGLADEPFINRSALMGMMAIRQALQDAGIGQPLKDHGADAQDATEQPLHIVLISGTTVAGMDITEQHFAQLQQSDAALQCISNHSPGRCTEMIARHFGIFDEYTTVSTACSSAANALLLGARMLREGKADIVVAGGTEALSLFHLNGFRSLMILDTQPCRPFCDTRAGLNLGEGAAYVVLEREETAYWRGAEPHACLSGFGNACDAFHQTASSDNGEGAYLAMKEALRTARLQPQNIDYINAHGTGTLNNDLSESAALQRIFGERLPPVSSTKGFTGHTTSASGSIEAVISLLALQHRFVPANIGWQRPMENGIIPTAGIGHCELQHVLCNSFGFGGNDTSLVFSRLPSAANTPGDDACSDGSPLAGDIKTQEEVEIKTLAKVEINAVDQLAEIRDFISPLQVRRMGKIMKSSLLASLKALRAGGITKPDAIVSATAMGCLENSEQLLRQILSEGENSVSPTLFMQSTHNTVSSNIAIFLGCHGYNITYSQDEDSLQWALRDAKNLLRSGQCRTVLVGLHDETTPLYEELMQRLDRNPQPPVHSVAILLTRNG